MKLKPAFHAGNHSAPKEQCGIELAPVGMLVAFGDGHVIATNRAWSELSSLSGPDSIGNGFLTVLAPAERPRFQDGLRRVAAGADQVSGDYHLEVGSARRWTRWWLRRHDHNGVPLVVMTVGDITGERGPTSSRAQAAPQPAS
jgi:PAS domain S-box-containing protein